METESVINELYCEAISQAEKVMIQSEEYTIYSNRREELEGKLRETFTKGQEDLFEQFMEAYIFASGIYETEIYRHGAAFGIKLTAEAFLLGKE